jgi:hypothetical protein
MPFTLRPFRRFPLAYFSGFWLLIMTLVLSSAPSAPAYAEWVLVSGDDSLLDIATESTTLKREVSRHASPTFV